MTASTASAPDPLQLPATTSITLDLVRALAAEAVVVGHAAVFFGVLPFLRPPYLPYVQNTGVVVFFLLSGYLISYTVFRKARSSTYTFRTFLIERFARIFSGFVPGLVFILAIDLVTVSINPVAYGHVTALRADLFLSNLLMLQDEHLGRWLAHLTDAARPIADLMVPFGSARPLWTIAIEWWIYLIFGWAMLVILRNPRSVRGWLVAAVFAVIPLYNLIGGRGDSLSLTWLMGAAAFWAGLRTPITWATSWSVAGAALFASVAALREVHTGDAYDAAFAAMLAVALFFVIAACRTTTFSWHRAATRVIRFAAGFSMTLYIVHYSVLVAVVAVADGRHRWLAFVTGIVLANVVAIVLAIPFEMRHKAFARWLLVRLPGGARPVPSGEPAGSPVSTR